MWEFGLGMMLAKLRREHPEETDAQLRDRLRAQLDTRPLDWSGVVPANRDR